MRCQEQNKRLIFLSLISEKNGINNASIVEINNLFGLKKKDAKSKNGIFVDVSRHVLPICQQTWKILES